MLSMLKKCPGIEVNIHVGPWPDFEEAMRSGDIDLYLGPIEAGISTSHKDEYEVVPFNQFCGWLYCRSGHPILQKNDISMQDVLQYKMAVMELVSPYAEMVYGVPNNKKNGRLNHNSRQDIVCDNHAINSSIVANSDVISIAMMNMIEHLLKEDKVVPIMKNSPKLAGVFGVTTIKKRPLTPATEMFIDSARDVLEELYQKEQMLMKKYGVSAP